MKKLFNDKRFKYGTYSTVITLVIIAILILINLVVGKFNRTFDLTGESTYSLSDETLEVLDRVDEKINIYTLFSTGSSDAVINKVEQVIDKYTQKNSNISVSNVDLYLHPDFAQGYANENQNVGVNGIIVECGDKYRLIDYEDYYTSYSSDYSTTEQLNIESNITSAIQYVTMEIVPKVYFITGHEETDYSYFTTLVDRLNLGNYQIERLNLLDKEVPEDCTSLFIIPGKKDYSNEETQKIKNYLANDGRAFFLLGGADVTSFPNIMSIVNAYGVSVEPNYVLEGSTENFYQYPYALFPNVEDHEINGPLIQKGYRVYSIASQAITNMEVKKQGLEIEPLLSTSSTAYIKAEGNSSPNKEKGDLTGPFNIAVAVTDSSYTDTSHTTKVVVCGGSYCLIEPTYDRMVVNANTSFVVSALNWLNDSTEGVDISPKVISSEMVLIDNSSANKIKLIGWGIIPGALFIAGFVIWLIRRNK